MPFYLFIFIILGHKTPDSLTRHSLTPSLTRSHVKVSIAVAPPGVCGRTHLRLVSLCCRNCPSWLQARTSRLGSLSMWIMRLMASNSTAFLALECCTFFDLGGSWALFRMVSKHSDRRFFTAWSSEDHTISK